MTIELIIIGDEILNGRTLDANLAWMAPWLFQKGLNLGHVTMVRDEPTQMIEAMTTAWKRSKIIITSGGIGPTLDDLTKAIMAEFAGKTLGEDANARAIVEKNYKRIDRDWTPQTNAYHLIPKDFIATDNPAGLAPGLVYINEGKALMAAPGVPKEFAVMVEKVFFPLLESKGFNLIGDQGQVVIRTFGVPEEKIFGELCPTLWKDLERFGKVSSLPHITGVDILVTFAGEANKTEYQKEIKNIVEATSLVPHVWQWGTLSLEEYIIQKAKKLGKTICFAESCTGGLVASKITDISGSSEVFLGSVVSYANSAKEDFLHVSDRDIKKFGAVSEQVAQAMAQGAREKFKADYCVSFSGIAGPSGGTLEKPVGLVCQGFSSATKLVSRSLTFKGDRQKLKERFAMSGLFWLLKELEAY